MNRRKFLTKTSLAALGTFLLSNKILAVEGLIRKSSQLDHKNYIIKNVEVLTMDEKLGHISVADILIENGIIKKIGKGIPIPSNYKIINGENAVVMPGLIDCHWHIWTSVMRSMPGYTKDDGYFPMSVKYSRLVSAEDMNIFSKYSLAEAINSGITSLSDFNHNTRSYEHAKAGLDAFAEMGIRGQFLYGDHRDLKDEVPTNFENIKKLIELTKNEKYNKIKVALGSRSVNYPKLKNDWAEARKLGMKIVIHASSRVKTDQGQIEKLYRMGLLGKDVNIIHGNAITHSEAVYVANAGSSVTMTPYSEMRIGYGFPPIQILKEHNILTGIGIDTVALSGDGNLFSTLKLLKNVGNASTLDEFYMNPYELLKMATINGAEILGIDDFTGSITEGKQADLILLKKDDFNFSSNSQTERLIIEAATPSNIDLVMVGGKIVKENGKLTLPDADQLLLQVQKAAERIQKQVEMK